MNVEATMWRVAYYIRLLDSVGLGVAARSWLPDPQDPSWKTPAGTRKRQGWRVVTMPPDAWLLLSKLTQRDVFGPRGGRAEQATAMMMSACQNVQAAVNLRRRHPALKYQAVAGHSNEIVTSWGTSPFWDDSYVGEDLTIWVPHYESGVTKWSATDVLPVGVDVRLGEPSEHLLFCIDPTKDVLAR